MQAATLEELRELSRRSRRAQAWGFLAIALVLVLVPAQLVLARFVSGDMAALLTLLAGGLLFLRYAHLAGQERGAFRKVFRRLKEERLTRTIVPTDVSPEGARPAQAARR